MTSGRYVPSDAEGVAWSGARRLGPAASHRLLIGLFLVALAVRSCGLLWGGVHDDENMSYPARVLSGQLMFRYHPYPPLYQYLHAVAFGVMFVVGRLIGVWPDVASFKAQYFTDPTPFLFAARFITAITGAFAAPIGAAIASRLGLGRRGSLGVGALMALLPINVWLCHFAKNDIGMMTATLLACWAAVRKLDEPDHRSSDLWFGLASALLVSFKQSAVFLLGPLWAGVVLISAVSGRRTWRAALGDTLVWTIVAAVACVPMNIGILIAPRSFLDYQGVLGQVWVKQGDSWRNMVSALGGTLSGATPIGLALGLLAPLLVRREARSWLIWWTALAGLSAFVLVGGPIAIERHLLPYSTLLYLLGAIAAVGLIRRSGAIARVAGVAGVLGLLGCASWGTVQVVRQALASPVGTRLASEIRQLAQPAGDTRILASAPIGLPIHPDVFADERARDRRLSEKYRLAWDPAAGERGKHASIASGSYYIRPFPWALGGTEKLRDDQLKTILPWPLQQEEWDLDYWLDRGFTIFVVRDEEAFVNSDVPAYARLHRQIRDRGALIARVETSRPLFLERPVAIYQFARKKPNPVAVRPGTTPDRS